MNIIASFSQESRDRCFTPPTWSRLEKLAKDHGHQLHWVPWVRPEPVEKFIATCKKNGGADILITCWGHPRVTPEVLDANPKLKLIAHSAGSVAGVDIDAWKRGVKVTNVMRLMSFAVAEFSVCLMLNGLRRFNTHVRPELKGTSPFYTFTRGGFALMGKRVGLVGLGIIGRQTIELLRPFRCEIVAYDPYVPADKIASLGAKKVELDELMRTSDVVSLHAPGTPATENILNETRLRMLKPGAILVNTARGIIIDHDALARVCADGKIAVYLDVTHPEPLPADHPLHRLSNVTLTHHIAGPTHDQWPLLGDEAIDEVERYLKGQTLQNVVTEAQYANQSRT
ncbi:MAG: hydroxyacid dehydrogenase [Phycisphaerales bacterium]|nr:hydroxyacid dehydrogenase [Phycisphaerales bacterium]